jgi:hypothetical protein
MYVYVYNELWKEAAPRALFAVKEALEWAKKYFEQRRTTFSLI